MSNEDLVQRIRAGERELILELWEQVLPFVRVQARRRYLLTDGLGGVEVEDLVQSGFLALLEAVESFQPEGGYSFLSCLKNHLKTAFSIAGGYRTRRQARDPLHHCKSLDTPIEGDDGDAGTLLDFQADPVDQYEDAERGIWLGQLREALDRALDDLPERERELLTVRYFGNGSLRDAGDRIGVSVARVQQLERRALHRLRARAKRSGLDAFIEEVTPYYARVGKSYFDATHTSAVELAVLERERLRERYGAGGE